MRLKITHRTEYYYEEPISYGLQQLRLTPKSSHGQQVLSWETTIAGGQREASYQDQHNNHVELVRYDSGRKNVSVLCTGLVETVDNAGIVGKHRGYAPLWYYMQTTDLTKTGPQIRKLVKQAGERGGDDVAHLHVLSALIGDAVHYEVGRTNALTTAEQALDTGHGVCQDHAHIFITAARAMGFPARYVSGYLLLDDIVDQDASHGWAEVHIAGLGWVGFDISNGISPDERYVRVATGLDYEEAAPISGMRFGDAGESLVVTLQVEQ